MTGTERPQSGYRWLARIDAWLNGVYTARWNPLYHSGALALVLLGVLLVTGVYLLVFYRVGAPYPSVARITEQAWAGRWIRGVHRFASDAVVVAAAVHAFRMYAQRRTWGPRALAWVSGVVLLGVVLATGWTGYVLVWDVHAQLLAVEGARYLDALPIFSEPLARAFAGERTVPAAFFFVNLFAHIALPIAVGALVWVHVARVARPVLVPARAVAWGATLVLVLLALVWPLRMAAPADLLRVPERVPLDWFFDFWVPLFLRLPPWGVWLVALAAVALPAAVPWLTRPAAPVLPAPATVDERTCTGCEQCVRDCPYDAIDMVTRTDGRDGRVARVKAELCTRCGVCIGSCPPMAIGPLGVTARTQLRDARAFLAQERPAASDVVIVGCDWSAARAAAEATGALLFEVPCVGAMHTSTVETLLRGGAGGVLVVGCPSHDGRTREGMAWAGQRLFEGRPADLKDRVDRSRLRLVEAALGEGVALHDATVSFADEIAALADATADAPDLVALCRAGVALPVGPGRDA